MSSNATTTFGYSWRASVSVGESDSGNVVARLAMKVPELVAEVLEVGMVSWAEGVGMVSSPQPAHRDGMCVEYEDLKR